MDSTYDIESIVCTRTDGDCYAELYDEEYLELPSEEQAEQDAYLEELITDFRGDQD